MSKPDGTKTINDLLEEFGDAPYTKEAFLKDKAAIEARFLLRGIQPDQIEPMINNFEIPEDELVQDWIEMMAFRPYFRD